MTKRSIGRRSPLPIEAIGGVPPSAAWGLRRLGAAVQTPAIRISRCSDCRTRDVGFLPGSPLLDERELAAYADGTAEIEQLFDQTGAGRHAVGHPNSRPRLSAEGGRHGRSIAFDLRLDPAIGPVGEQLIIPPELQIPLDGHSFLAVCRTLSTSGINLSPGQLGSDGMRISGGWSATGARHVVTITGAELVADPQKSPLNAGLFGWTCGDGRVSLVNRDRIESVACHPGITMLHGGTIGASECIAAGGFVEILSVLIYARALSRGELAAARRSLHCLFDIPPSPERYWLAAGDSITFGTGATLLRSYPRLVSAQFDDLTVFGAGHFGQSIANMQANFPVHYQGFASDGASGTSHRFATILAGTNDLAGDASGSGTFQQLAAWCDQAKGEGYHVGLATILPRIEFVGSRYEQWKICNELIRSHWHAHADLLIDIAADPRLGPIEAAANPTLYFDGIHPADQGHALLAGHFADAIRRLPAPFQPPPRSPSTSPSALSAIA